MAVARTVVSDWHLNLGALEDAVVVAGDDVGAYLFETWRASGALDLSTVLGRIAPPFEHMWVEFRSPNRHGLYSWGVLLQSESSDVLEGRDAGRWTLRGSLVLEQRRGHPVGPVIDFVVPVEDDGSMRRRPDGSADWYGRPASAALGQIAGVDGEEIWDEQRTSDITMWLDELEYYIYSALLTVSFMHCKNVDLVPSDPSPALSRKHQRQTGRSLTRYYTLDITPMRKVLSGEGLAQENGLPLALHICRGHFKTFTDIAPLFGKLRGTYWWADHIRGDQQDGRIEKDYRVRIAVDGFGGPYREADELAPQASAVPGLSPDLTGRGWIAHAATQNALARAVISAGWSPLSPKPAEPQYDLAWVTPDAIWVCEVKSITQQSEMSQMHSAIGQVIDYAHRVEDSRPIQRMIALERPPFSEHWIDECTNSGIVLAWPEVFALAVSSRLAD